VYVCYLFHFYVLVSTHVSSPVAREMIQCGGSCKSLCPPKYVVVYISLLTNKLVIRFWTEVRFDVRRFLISGPTYITGSDSHYSYAIVTFDYHFVKSLKPGGNYTCHLL
jgi:hypothetical protein